MNCIEVSIKKLNKEIKPSILKHDGIIADVFSIGVKLNSKIRRVSDKLVVSCSVICDTSLL